MFNVPKKEEQLEIQVKREHLFILCLISSSKFLHYYLCQPTKYQGPLFSSKSELYCTLSFSLTKGPIGLDASIHERVGRTVLNSKQISEWPLSQKILMTPLTN
ncbi:hypothetical protein CMV_016318 [Castanea mollissima]|uniref:Uncharacterized protein n=1 Tax=Castanea mollissima TaxID=60419 RepID=A0A8J4VIB7_9ROSI|nr:hypothetical protein CMV_016318 [Castanea mollissima]